MSVKSFGVRTTVQQITKIRILLFNFIRALLAIILPIQNLEFRFVFSIFLPSAIYATRITRISKFLAFVFKILYSKISLINIA